MIVTRAAPTVLSRGSHKSPDVGMCLTEAVAWMAGEPHTDRPKCCSPVLASFGRAWNDGMRSDEERAQLLPYILRLVGTAGDPAADERRAWMAADWLIRVHTPAWLDLAGLSDYAAGLRAASEINSVDTLVIAQPLLDAARAAAGVAAGDAAGAVAARVAAGVAARAAAGDAARDAAWAAARVAAGVAARDAAGAVAARVAAGDAARAAAGDAAWAVAARVALEPTVQTLQADAHNLFDRMINA